MNPAPGPVCMLIDHADLLMRRWAAADPPWVTYPATPNRLLEPDSLLALREGRRRRDHRTFIPRE